ncbi:MAG: hypothetical protein U0792_22775 [Gemmataceae bacterium]
MKPEQVLALCRDAGIRLTCAGTKLKFAASPGTVDVPLKELLAAHKTELLELLGALDLMSEADAEVERLGSHGTDPEIAACAEAAVDAYSKRDIAGVRVACVLIRERARELHRHDNLQGAHS